MMIIDKPFLLAAGKLAAARELSRRMNLSDLSQEAFGFDVAEFPMGLEGGVEASTSEPISPTKSRLFGSAHKRTKSNGTATGAQPSLLFQQSQTMRDLESLTLAFDALENFALIWEKLDKCVTFVSCRITYWGLTDMVRNRRRRDSGTARTLLEELQESLDEVGMHVDSVLDEWLIPDTDGKRAPCPF